MFLVELIASSFLDLISKQARLHAPVSAFLCLSKRWGGGEPNLVSWALSLSRDLWQWCLQRQIRVSATHIPGILNVTADRESRFHLDSSDWKICPAVFHILQTDYTRDLRSWSIRYIIRENDMECNNVIPPTPFALLLNVFIAVAFSRLFSFRMACSTKRLSFGWPQVPIGTTKLLNSFFLFVCLFLLDVLCKSLWLERNKDVIALWHSAVSCYSYDVSYTSVWHYFQFSFYALNFC